MKFGKSNAWTDPWATPSAIKRVTGLGQMSHLSLRHRHGEEFLRILTEVKTPEKSETEAMQGRREKDEDRRVARESL